ncbi:hypothetical protein LP420_14710 [Massilia sp. B-10]|nr:hypothetical protein LP420_14710 [Massilia sp. B-10]
MSDLIAEPWAIGGNSYQVGGFPDRLGRVERRLPRHGAHAAEQARIGIGHARPARIAHGRVERPVWRRRPPAHAFRELHHRA